MTAAAPRLTGAIIKIAMSRIVISPRLLESLAIGLLLLAGVSHLAAAQQAKPSKSEKTSEKSRASNPLVAHGKYLVEDIAMCGMCHTPRDASGNLDRNRWLEGGPLWLQPAMPAQDWPLQAPRIGGSPPGSDAELITLLTTGIWRDGKPLRPPMPQFRMTREDASAVVAYLRSLNAGPRN